MHAGDVSYASEISTRTNECIGTVQISSRIDSPVTKKETCLAFQGFAGTLSVV